jgi:aryl-alcohol dehydrogenase-like predicted oxidoreductase
MNFRTFGKTGWDISAVSFGAWAIGGSWGQRDDEQAMKTLHRAVDLGVNFFDTADVYGNGHSEKLLGRLKAERSENLIIATKAGRRLNPHTAQGYNRENLTRFIERSVQNLHTEALDLVQLHCPPTEVYYMPEVFGILDDLTQQGKIKHYGVSVEKVEEALKAIEYPNVKSVQIIFNIFRQRPAELFFHEAKRKNIAVIARVPLASGLLTGKMKKDTAFEETDHRHFNRYGEAFDRGETFAGLDYEQGLSAVELLKPLVPAGTSMAQLALRWILMFGAVSCVIPGARKLYQVEDNAQAADLPSLSIDAMAEIQAIYDEHVREYVHQYW